MDVVWGLRIICFTCHARKEASLEGLLEVRKIKLLRVYLVKQVCSSKMTIRSRANWSTKLDAVCLTSLYYAHTWAEEGLFESSLSLWLLIPLSNP